jgi:hypothetical protein
MVNDPWALLQGLFILAGSILFKRPTMVMPCSY